MKEPLKIEVTLFGGPLDGAELTVPVPLRYLLAALGNEVHGYAFREFQRKGRWIYRHDRLLARTGEGTRAAEVLRKSGKAVVELPKTED